MFIIFFLPRENKRLDDGFTASIIGKDFIKNKYCTCIGFTKMKPGLSRSDTQIQLCYGLPINCEYSCRKEINGQWQDISCDEITK